MLVHEVSGYRAASAADPHHESTRVIRPLAWEPSHQLVCVTVTEWPCVMGIVIFTVDAAQVTVCASSWFNPSIAHQCLCSSEANSKKSFPYRARYVPNRIGPCLLDAREPATSTEALFKATPLA